MEINSSTDFLPEENKTVVERFKEGVSMERIPYLLEKSGKLPLSPGVYYMKNKSGKIIYIGKAKSLKNRVNSYFHNVYAHLPKTFKLVSNVYDFDFIVTDTELDALILEASQIKLHQPKYNILLKDDKGFNYIKVTKEDFPKISYIHSKEQKTGHLADESYELIGPYTSGYSVRHLVSEVLEIFKLPLCNKVFKESGATGKPCLYSRINRCIGLCKGEISKEEYGKIISSSLDYIKNGAEKVVERLTVQMKEASEAMEFEKAAQIRDKISSISRVQKAQKIVIQKTEDFDCIALTINVKIASAAVVSYRKGLLFDKQNFFIGDEYDKNLMLTDFIEAYYSLSNIDIPKEILTDSEINESEKEILSEFLSKKSGKKVILHCPKRGEGLTRVLLAKSNASEYLALKTGKNAKALNTAEALAKLLGLSKIPEYIECFDISNMGNDFLVCGMTVHKDGKPFRQGYRKFKIKTVEGQDDFACLAEVIERRLKYLTGEYENNGNNTFFCVPDLIFVDGGAGQVSATRAVMEKMQIDNIPLFGLVKDQKHRTKAISAKDEIIEISANKALYSFLTGIQDETHRFANYYRESSHKKASFELSISNFKGIGEKKSQTLLKTFKTITALKKASPEEISSVAKIPLEKAQEFLIFLQNTK